MGKITFLGILIISTVLFGQRDTTQLLESALIKQDIDSLITKLKEVHPTFGEYFTKNHLQSKIDSIKNSINQPISSLDFFRIMQPIISIDGHTTLVYSGKVYPQLERPFFPFKVIIENNLLFVKENLSENKTISKGSIIASINGVPAKKIISDLIKYLPGEKINYKTKSLEHQFHYIYRIVKGAYPEFHVAIGNKNLSVSGAKQSDFKDSQPPKFELRFYDNDIAYISKRKFSPPKDFITFMDSAFSIISERHIKYLIINNLRGGGMTDLADSLMNYFTKKPFLMFNKILTKISPLTQNFINTKKSEGFVNNGFFVQEFKPHNTPFKNKFSGATYILVGPLSYSTGTCFPAAAKCFQTAFVIGQETGQPLLSNGNLSNFVLKNTQLSCVTSLSIIFMPCNNDDVLSGVIPDYNVNPRLEDLLDDKEIELEYALKLIRDNKEKN